MSSAPQTEPFHAEGTVGPDGRRVGVLLSHGFTGSPASMRPWAEHLHALGYTVSVPRLPGHGTRWQDLNQTTYDDWYGEISEAFDKLNASCDVVVAVGLSMGGSLVLRLAAERGRDVAGLVLVNPAVNSARWDVKLLPVMKHVLGSFPGIGNDIKKPGGNEYGYDRTPLRAAHSLMTGWKRLRPLLPQVTQPILMLRSRVDHVVDPSSARIIASSVSSREIDERTLENSFHVATLDNDAPEIFDASAEFIARVTAQT